MTLAIELPDDTFEALLSEAEYDGVTASERVQHLVKLQAKRPMPTEDGKRWLIGLPPLATDLDDFAEQRKSPVPKQTD